MGSKGSKKGYGRLKSLVREHLAEEGTIRGDAVKAILEDTPPEPLMRWLPRLFWESPGQDRAEILRGLVPPIGSAAVPFLEDVLESPRSVLKEKRLALEQLEALGRTPDAACAEDLRKAEDFVASLPERLQDAGNTETAAEEGLNLLQGLSPVFRGVVLRELLHQPLENVSGFLVRVLEGREGLWDEILEDLEAAPNEQAGLLLQAGYERADKALRKKIRRAHHRRSGRGLTVYPLEREEAEEAVWRPPVPPRPEGLLSLPDPAGTRMVWVIRPNVRRGMLVFGGWVDDQRGLVKFFVMDPSRKESEQYKASVLANPELPVVECDAGFCASILEEAYQSAAPPDPEEAEAFKAVRPMLKEVIPPEKPAAPVYAVFSDEQEEAVVQDPLGESASLLNEDLLSAWAIEAQRIQPHLEKLEAIEESRIIVHPMQKRERMDALFREIAGQILSDPVSRNSWRRRLEDAAWVFYKKDLEGQARRLAHMSRALQDPEKDASRIAFFVELVRRQMEGQLQQKKKEEKGRPSLIVKPS